MKVAAESTDGSGAGQGYAPLLANEERCTLLANEEPPTSARFTQSATGGDVLQFSAPLCYVDRDEGEIRIDVIRIGRFQGQCSVTVSTEDGTATDGDDYRAICEKVVFEDGEDHKTVSINIIQKQGFETTEEFKLTVSDPVNCHLGKFLYRCRVKVLGRGTFPTDKYSEQLSRGMAGITEVGGWSLFHEYLKFVLAQEGMLWRTVCAIIIDQLPNANLYLGLWISIYFVDSLFDEDVTPFIPYGPHNGRIYTAYAIASAFIIPVTVMHIFNLIKVYINLEGRISNCLKMHLTRKYLNYTDESRQLVSPTRLDSMMTQKCDELALSYMTMLRLLFIFGKALFLYTFEWFRDKEALFISGSMPVLMALFAAARISTLRAAGAENYQAFQRFNKAIHEVGHYFDLIAVYQKRPQAEEGILKYAKDHADKANNVEVVHTNNEYLSHTLAPLFIALHICLNAEEVLAGQMPLGTFITTIAVFKELSGVYAEAYATCMKLSASHAPLKQVTECLNLPVDLAARKNQNRGRRATFLKARKNILAERRELRAENSTPATDQVEMEMIDMSYTFPQRPLFENVSVSQRPGGIIAICGTHGCGKSTLMRLLSNILLPSGGTVFVPSHLRTIYVDQKIPVLDESAWDNITYGDPAASPQRVMEIASAMKMSYLRRVLLDDLKKLGRLDEVSIDFRENTDDGDNDRFAHWREELTQSEAAKLRIGRALVMSPEVLCLQRPLGNFSFNERTLMMDLLKEFVTEKGFKLDPDAKASRRPRTLFFSPTWREDLDEADVIWEIDGTTVSTRHQTDMTDLDKDRLFEGVTVQEHKELQKKRSSKMTESQALDVRTAGG